MRTLQVSFDGINYPYLYGRDCFDEIAACVGGLKPDRIYLIADGGIARQWGRPLADALSAHGPTEMLVQPVGETHKCLARVEGLIEQMFASGATRASVVVAFGGGLTGNLAGLVAALMFRGIRLVHVPTTLVAMLDSVISLKQAVNSQVAKNVIGTYQVPEIVLADIRVLTTLPVDHIRAGLCEMAKNALAILPDHIERVADCGTADLSADLDAFETVLMYGVEAKLRVMAHDRFERKMGLLLEYGHTIGHAIELEATSMLPHGYAVGLGMLVAAETSGHLGCLQLADIDSHWWLLERLGAPCHLPATISPDVVMKRALADNKRGYIQAVAGCLPMILLEALGRPIMHEQLPLVSVPATMVARGLDAVSAT